MSAEIICVGTELLLGNIVNTNAQFLAQELADLGIPHYYETVVGDNPQRLQQAIAIAIERASILIFTGGLGPTPDDLTTEAIASFFQTSLIEDPAILTDIKAKFAQTGREMTPNNAKQALIPQGAQVLPNPVGTAPGMIWQPRPGLIILTFPGVPREMKAMWRTTAVPYLKSQGWGKEIIYSRLLKFRGIGESALAAKVAKFFDMSNPTVAPYASLGEVKLRLSAKASSVETAVELIEPMASEIIAIAGLDYCGSDEDTLASVVGKLLTQRQETISVAESCTGGGIGQLLTSVGGSSAYFSGGIISYDNSLKIQLLGVKAQDLAEFGAVSPEVAQQMALNVKHRLNTHWGLSVTGIAGPEGGTTSKPVGLVYFGFADPYDQVDCLVFHFGPDKDRETIRYLSVHYAIDQLRRKLSKFT
ncbi:competence/damage-inducible protein A [Gloeocapsa sp. PCC 73106]|uniref:competence/damage-inducible protein A n=1 Tax=Gloeocapsa sp. PCC 73106 TaxID=102232 RepID=UPI0002AC6F66|nr:competence/damage-inducible protein A [Gloeocapsa sp. PCC 73106]ELR99226.1 competence/damage-inducible protein CinA-like protein [Gloeocapsa sp. PCC 73106]